MANFQLTMTREIIKLADQLDGFQKKQLPFAKARALWFTAIEAKKSIPEAMSQVFTIRKNKKNPWPFKQMRISPESMAAIRKEGGECVTLATKDPIGAMLSLGGKRYRKDGEPLAVPILGGARQNSQTIIRLGRNDIKTIVTKPNAFVIKPKSKPGQYLIMLRRKKYQKGEPRYFGKRHNTSSPITLMYSLKQETTIKPMWRLDVILQRELQARLPEKFIEACEHAMKTAKP